MVPYKNAITRVWENSGDVLVKDNIAYDPYRVSQERERGAQESIWPPEHALQPSLQNSNIPHGHDTQGKRIVMRSVKDIEREMAEWKKDLRYLDGVKANTIVTEQKKHIMIGMMPDTIADQMTINYKKEETYEAAEQNMVGLVERILQREKKSIKEHIGNMQEPLPPLRHNKLSV